MKRYLLTFGLISLALTACGENGKNGKNGQNGKDGASCSFTANSNGTTTISCPDGSSFTVQNGEKGQKGDAGSDGEKGQNGTYCQLVENSDGSQAVVCPADGTSYIVRGNPDHYQNYCLPGYWGPNCTNWTSCVHGYVDQKSGRCICNQNFAGAACDLCENELKSLESGCTECQNDLLAGPDCKQCKKSFMSAESGCTECENPYEVPMGDHCACEDPLMSGYFCNECNDPHQYGEVEINGVIWTSQNVYNPCVEHVLVFREETSNQDNYASIFGYFYNWQNAQKACPKGWHLPSKEEYDSLVNYTDTKDGSTNLRCNCEIGHWHDNDSNNTFGFNAHGIGMRFKDTTDLYENPNPNLIWDHAYFWTSSKDVTNGSTMAYRLDINKNNAVTVLANSDVFLSVRCVKDAN